ncbi:male-specific histamine-binding salivary protein-like [Haemaphysalis longicornis]
MFRFMNGTDDQVYNVTETVDVVNTSSYSNGNAIRYTLSDGSNLTDSLIFTDGKKCDVFHIPYKNNGSGCELWVRKEYADKIPDCCLFIFETFCGPDNYYDVYTKEKCANAAYMKANARRARM